MPCQIETEIIDCMSDMLSSVVKQNTIMRTGKTIMVKIPRKNTKAKAMKDGVCMGYNHYDANGVKTFVPDDVVIRARDVKTETNAQLLEIFPAFVAHRAERKEMEAMAMEDINRYVPEPEPVVEDIEDVPIAQLIVAKKAKKARKPKPMVPVEVVVANQVRTFWFPEEVWDLIKSYLDLAPKSCQFYNHDHAVICRVFCFPVVKTNRNDAITYTYNADGTAGDRVFTETAVTLTTEKKWFCGFCARRQALNESGDVASYGSLERFRMEKLRTERYDWYIERHGALEHNKAVGAGSRHIKILRNRYWAEWEMEKNIADLQKYYAEYMLEKRRSQNRMREALIEEIDRHNEYKHGTIVAKERKEAFIRELTADFTNGELDYKSFTKLMRTTLTFSTGTFRYEDWRNSIIRNSNLNSTHDSDDI